ncbi:radical SAM protein, partial [Planctomycetota bacterium]
MTLPCQCSSFPDKHDRKGAFFAASQSICPVCRTVIQAKIVLRDGQVVMSKRCGQHGSFEAVLSSDMDYWVKSLTYTKPGTIPREHSTAVADGCPADCGLCPDHEQHTCAAMIEINNRCDLQCPICIVWNQNSYDMTVDEFRGIVDGLIEKEGSLELILLSGGEPTLHPEFFRLAEYAVERPEINRVLVSSHGLRIARDRSFAERFKEMGLYLSLQFDSLKDESYVALRGRKLLEDKQACLSRCAELGIPTVFVPTIARGINDG